VIYQPRSLTGLVRAFSVGQPKRFTLRSRVSSEIPTSRAHCDMFMVFPLKVSSWLLRLLLACSNRVAQRQFSGEYGPLLSGYLSKECILDGRGPISDRNLSKESHLGSTEIPRPPYSAYDRLEGLMHLFLIPLHVRCSVVPFNEWVVCRTLAASLREHRHFVVFLMRKFPVVHVTAFPHTQRQFQRDLDFKSSSRPITVSEPKTWPDRSNVFMPTLYQRDTDLAMA